MTSLSVPSFSNDGDVFLRAPTLCEAYRWRAGLPQTQWGPPLSSLTLWLPVHPAEQVSLNQVSSTSCSQWFFLT
jgi:hypothetical protein